jgi:hypothetical protein
MFKNRFNTELYDIDFMWNISDKSIIKIELVKVPLGLYVI